VGDNHAFHTLLDARVGANLGRGVGPDGVLPEENQRRALDALNQLVARVAPLGILPNDIPVVATAAVRNAPNGAAFMERVRREAGLVRARVLTGEEEALLGYRAALLGLAGQGQGRFSTLDLGGGSFQLAVGTARALERGGSTQVGSNRVQGWLGTYDRVTPEHLAGVDARLAAEAPLPLPADALAGRTLAAVGGISRFLRTHLGRPDITTDEVEALRRALCARDAAGRLPLVLANRTPDERVALGADTPEGALDAVQKLPAKLTLLLHILRTAGMPGMHASDTDARHQLILGGDGQA
jgi:exopolyphosphatase/guanosine-5'-triphosphate,3'-diphosphate pyrophosphatase